MCFKILYLLFFSFTFFSYLFSKICYFVNLTKTSIQIKDHLQDITCSAGNINGLPGLRGTLDSRTTVMPGLHSHHGYSSRLSGSCEQDKVRVNVDDIHTLVQELQGCFNNEARQDEVCVNVDVHILMQELQENFNNEASHLCPLTSEHTHVPWRDNDIQIAWCLMVIYRSCCLASERLTELSYHAAHLFHSSHRNKYFILACNNFMGFFARQTTHSAHHLPQHEYCFSILYIAT